MRFPYRWILPLGHLFADLAIVVFMSEGVAWHARMDSTSAVRTVALQDDATVAWDPIYDVLPTGLLVIETANPLAAGGHLSAT